MQKVLLYDPKRAPSDWTGLIRPGQYAAFISDVETSAPVESDGSLVNFASQHFCLLFDSLAEAESYCREAVAKTPRLKCEVFDSQGRRNAPVAVLVNPEFAHKLDTEVQGQRLINLGLLALVLSVPLFLYAWRNDASVVWWPVLLGINVAVAGLRFIQWGQGVKEEIRYQRKEAERRLGEIAAEAASK